MEHSYATQAASAAFKKSSPPISLDSDPIIRLDSQPVHVLVVDDDEHIREVCRSVAEASGMKVFATSTAEDALEVMEVSPVDIVLTDLRLLATNGIELLKTVTGLYPDVAVVMLTQYGTIDSAVKATRLARGRLRYETVSPGRGAREAATSRPCRAVEARKSIVTRAGAHPAGIWRTDRDVSADGARLQAD